MMLPEWEEVQLSINETGKLPPGYRTSMILFSEIRGWHAFINGPKGATMWLEIGRIPSDAATILR